MEPTKTFGELLKETADLSTVVRFDMQFKSHDDAIAWISEVIRRGTPNLHGLGVADADGEKKILCLTMGASGHKFTLKC
jgi:hypothetical protein